eukprot:CAMPEP_0171676660 /NCGR_PEP_ID=MMETSP0990-20121206/54577_1 /TAXON_ID=483369 /ORGANISM="non described non described, Strain CCMP2098" /LENGTH=51 /DNA_ID=CAMNT_0012262903 /DNA_START=147 /DNA_END=299 /DNA_ORIENTATION=-
MKHTKWSILWLRRPPSQSARYASELGLEACSRVVTTPSIASSKVLRSTGSV